MHERGFLPTQLYQGRVGMGEDPSDRPFSAPSRILTSAEIYIMMRPTHRYAREFWKYIVNDQDFFYITRQVRNMMSLFIEARLYNESCLLDWDSYDTQTYQVMREKRATRGIFNTQLGVLRRFNEPCNEPSETACLMELQAHVFKRCIWI